MNRMTWGMKFPFLVPPPPKFNSRAPAFLQCCPPLSSFSLAKLYAIFQNCHRFGFRHNWSIDTQCQCHSLGYPIPLPCNGTCDFLMLRLHLPQLLLARFIITHDHQGFSFTTNALFPSENVPDGGGWDGKKRTRQPVRAGVEGGCLPLYTDFKLPTVMIARKKPLQRERQFTRKTSIL